MLSILIDKLLRVVDLVVTVSVMVIGAGVTVAGGMVGIAVVGVRRAVRAAVVTVSVVVVGVRAGVTGVVVVGVSDDSLHDSVAMVVSSMVSMVPMTMMGNMLSVVARVPGSGYGGSKESSGKDHCFKLNLISLKTAPFKALAFSFKQSIELCFEIN